MTNLDLVLVDHRCECIQCWSSQYSTSYDCQSVDVGQVPGIFFSGILLEIGPIYKFFKIFWVFD